MFWVCVRSLIIQHVNHMRPFMFSYVACLFPTKFYHFTSQPAINLEKRAPKFSEYKIYVSNTCKIFWDISQYKRYSGMQYHNAQSVHMKCPVLLSDLNVTWVTSTQFRKIPRCQITWKSGQWETSWTTQTNRQTDWHDEATSHLPQVANAPKTWKLWSAVSCSCIQTATTRYLLHPNILASTLLNT